jgi:phosphoglycerate kinase
MAIKRAPKRSVIVLENVRFYPGEEANDEAFARQLASDSGAEYFVQDGFGVVHRAHASTAAITLFLPSVAGLLLEREYMTITEAMKHPKRPLVAVMGGAKVSDKIGVIEAMIPIADTIVVSGAMANTFLSYKGCNMGKSKVEAGQEDTIKQIYRAAEKKVGKDAVDSFIVLPVDLGVGTSLEPTATRRDVSVFGVGNEAMALDIGPKSIQQLSDIVAAAKTVIWNGDLGMAEIPAFAKGSTALAAALVEHKDCMSIIGGGDTADFAIHWDPKHGDSFSHVSTGGGASLELMSGLPLPGIESLLDA